MLTIVYIFDAKVTQNDQKSVLLQAILAIYEEKKNDSYDFTKHFPTFAREFLKKSPRSLITNLFMRIIRIAILSLILALPMSSGAQKHDLTPEDIEAVLVELDSAIARKDTIHAMRQARADSLLLEVNACHPDVYVKKCIELYNSLADFDGKQALKALELIQMTNQYQEDPHLHVWTDLNASNIYGIMGLYHKATNITGRMNPQNLSIDERLYYYHTCLGNYEKISDYMSDISVVQDEEKQVIAYYDSILAIQPEGIGRDITLANKEIYLQHPQKAKEAIMKRFSQSKGKEHIQMCGALASVYGLLNDKPRHIYYLALAALEDINNGTTEYQALPYLVHALYEQYDIDRAYAYLMCTMEDANIYPSRSLGLDVSRYFPLINTSYSNHKDYIAKSDKQKRNSLFFTFGLLALSIGVAFYLGWHRNNAAVERKRADELQKALDQAEIADRIKTVFIQNMRHEIRTPLNAIMGFAQLMSNDLTDEERTLYNGYIQESNNQLLSTLDSIIDVSNMEVGTFNFQFEEVDVDELCKAKMEDTRELLPAGVEYTYKPQHVGMKLYTDRKRVGQVLYNLLSNSCKNTTQGRITLSVAHYIANDCIQFVVTDTGRGIPVDKAKLIFEHFEKIDHYSPGLGLGLYVCRLIARALGGDIYLDAQYSMGARFIFTVPNNVEGTHTEEEEEEENIHQMASAR